MQFQKYDLYLNRIWKERLGGSRQYLQEQLFRARYLSTDGYALSVFFTKRYLGMEKDLLCLMGLLKTFLESSSN